MSELTVLSPVAEQPDDEARAELAPRGELAGLRLTVIENGKPRAHELLGALAAGLKERHGLAAVTIFSKPGASQPVSDETVQELAAGGDVFLTGLGDCGGCSACSLQDALLMERAGRPATVLISDPFQGRIASYAAKLGAPGYGVVVAPHPVATRSAEFLADLAEQLVDGVARNLGRLP
ncbi:hypothetical protein EFK50_11820 [Nocardioides marmoriginsengisoli]|uniref:UGSC-like domain-containing protein n=1 Tax=Nocardioides marmoriginsengisoli TaxID=661483 RepID=A0A3N0CHG9_9ACTN|nr:hypothetical protein [Nocardioides marmoriginsengisoli]RNL62453.1 hypothetical protein EFK50_11820 [Nocardioides marmoriginsengisoli]